MTDQQTTQTAAGTTTAASDAAAVAAAAATTQTQTGSAAPGNTDPWFTRPDLALDDEAKTYLSGKAPPSLGEFIKTTKHYEQIARDRNAIQGPVPGKELEWEGWEKTFGWTPDATKYGVEKPAVKDGVPYTPEFHDAFVKTLHEHKVPPTVAKGIVAALGKRYEANYQAALDTVAAEDAAVKAALQKDWGSKFDANEEIARRAARFLGIGMEDMAELDDVIGSPRLVKAFHKIGELLGEDKLVSASNGGQGGFGSMSPASAEVMQKQLEADPEFVKSLNDPRHPQHAANTEKRRQLFVIQAGGK